MWMDSSRIYENFMYSDDEINGPQNHFWHYAALRSAQFMLLKNEWMRFGGGRSLLICSIKGSMKGSKN